ncbi:enamelin [Mixophyes fleayi]|uniref:enamelin n=1 Tax=Mixophyes fleayi TaxID=3061075 RepID=UPI003F4D9810
MIDFLLFLYLLQPSAAIPMQFPFRGSNSEEGAPYGSYNHLNLQMPHAGSMYGYGLPHYSQMIQLQQALSRQPFPWQPQGKAQTQQNNKEVISPQVPRYPIIPQLPQQPSIAVQQPQPNYQPVTKQPLQLPPIPDPQIPQMFLPFLNPGNPFWPQGNYFGYFGVGGRPPYNSEEANEDEEAAKEKEPPAAEPPVTESSNTTVDTNSTTVDHGLGNSTAQNESFVGENPQSTNVRLDSQNIYSAGMPMTPSIHGRHVNISPGAAKPSNHFIRSPQHQNILRNQHQKYYTVNRVFTGRGDHANGIHPRDHFVNTSPPVHHLPSEKRFFTGEHTSYGDKFSGRAPMQGESEVRGILHSPKLSITRNGDQQYNGNNLVNQRDFSKHLENGQQREHPIWLGNKNNVPNRNVIIVQPERNEYFTEYSRHPLVEVKKQNIPRGIFSRHHNSQFQPKQSETVQKSNLYENRGTTVSQNSNILLKNDNPYKQSGTFDTGSTWSNRHISTQIDRGDTGPLQETIYLVSNLPSDSAAVYTHHNPKQNQFEHPSEQQGSPDYSVGQRKNISPENDLHGKTSTLPHSENQNWQGNDFTTTQFDNFQLQPYSWVGTSRNIQAPLAEQNKRKAYINNDRYQNSQREFLLISKPGPLKTQEQLQFSTNGPLYQFKEMSPGSQKPISSLDHTAYYPEYETDSPNLNKNTQYSASRTFDPTEGAQYTHGDELHLGQKSPIHLQLSPFPETQPWSYNPEEIPSEQNEHANFGSYPSGMRGQSPYQREVITDYGGSQLYTCTLPFAEYDSGRGLSDSLLYVCCKLSHVEQGRPSGAVDSTHEFRLTLKEYNDWVPYQDRTHRQHTRNVIDPPNIGYNQRSNSVMPNCNVSNINDNTMTSGREHLEGIPCAKKACDTKNLEYPYQGFDVVATTPCQARGDADNFLPPKQEVLSSQKKILVGSDKAEILPINVQEDGSIHGGVENDVRVKKGTGKLLRVLTCPQVQMHASDLPASLDRNKPNAFSLKHEIPNGQPGVDTQDGSMVLHQPPGNDPESSPPDCLILNK